MSCVSHHFSRTTTQAATGSELYNSRAHQAIEETPRCKEPHSQYHLLVTLAYSTSSQCTHDHSKPALRRRTLRPFVDTRRPQRGQSRHPACFFLSASVRPEHANSHKRQQKGDRRRKSAQSHDHERPGVIESRRRGQSTKQREPHIEDTVQYTVGMDGSEFCIVARPTPTLNASPLHSVNPPIVRPPGSTVDSHTYRTVATSRTAGRRHPPDCRPRRRGHVVAARDPSAVAAVATACLARSSAREAHHSTAAAVTPTGQVHPEANGHAPRTFVTWREVKYAANDEGTGPRKQNARGGDVAATAIGAR